MRYSRRVALGNCVSSCMTIVIIISTGISPMVSYSFPNLPVCHSVYIWPLAWIKNVHTRCDMYEYSGPIFVKHVSVRERKWAIKLCVLTSSSVLNCNECRISSDKFRTFNFLLPGLFLLIAVFIKLSERKFQNASNCI